MRHTSDDAANAVNRLLRGEISAVETFRQALARLGDEPEAAGLRQIQRDHEKAVLLLKQHASRRGAEPAQGSGPWGAFARAVTGAARNLGDTPAIKSLKEGSPSPSEGTSRGSRSR
jgi:hypothetical protein